MSSNPFAPQFHLVPAEAASALGLEALLKVVRFQLRLIVHAAVDSCLHNGLNARSRNGSIDTAALKAAARAMTPPHAAARQRAPTMITGLVTLPLFWLIVYCVGIG
jgi:hypothetical protein